MMCWFFRRIKFGVARVVWFLCNNGLILLCKYDMHLPHSIYYTSIAIGRVKRKVFRGLHFLHKFPIFLEKTKNIFDGVVYLPVPPQDCHSLSPRLYFNITSFYCILSYIYSQISCEFSIEKRCVGFSSYWIWRGQTSMIVVEQRINIVV
jgi:hypothetical protein